MSDRDTLYAAVITARDSKQAIRLWIRRCEDHCWLAAGYWIRGSVVVIAQRSFVNGEKERGAWRAEDLPAKALLGCGKHNALHKVEIHQEGFA